MDDRLIEIPEPQEVAPEEEALVRGRPWGFALAFGFIVNAALVLFLVTLQTPILSLIPQAPGKLLTSYITKNLAGTTTLSGTAGNTVNKTTFPFSPISTTTQTLTKPTVNDTASAIINTIKEPTARGVPIKQVEGQVPIRIVIPDANVSAPVTNPDTTDINVLSQALLSGAVRYPTTTLPGTPGTMLVFGHSSYLSKVHNLAYKTFDGVQNLTKGQIISVYTATAEFRYAVESVRVVNAADASQNTISLPNDGIYLVIVTCDTFASVSDRFVVNANFVGEFPL